MQILGIYMKCTGLVQLFKINTLPVGKNMFYICYYKPQQYKHVLPYIEPKEYVSINLPVKWSTVFIIAFLRLMNINGSVESLIK